MSGIRTAAIETDVVIFGGGVAGLWLLNRLRQSGYRAVLVENEKLGAGQTRYAQGIIHGGTKYALTGVLTASASAVGAMPPLWSDCLGGRGPIDLRGVQVLSDSQYLWSTASLSSRMAGFFASKVMQSRTRALDASERPAIFTDSQFRGQVYRLNEPVLDTASLVRTLAEPHRDLILRADWPDGVAIDPSSMRVRLHSDEGTLELSARRLVFAAGQGNRPLLDAVGHATPEMQLRPLQMVMVRGELPTAYAHCLGASSVPRITISTHRDGEGRPVWYLGGQLAEEGVERAPGEQIAAARRELEALLPWIDLSGAQWSTARINRAEVKYEGGKRPDDAFVDDQQGIITGWPTKLALAPRLSDAVIDRLEAGGVRPDADFPPEERERMAALPAPDYAPLPWEEESRWS